MLGMSEEVFWKCTPKKFFALVRVHMEIELAKSGATSKGNKGDADSPKIAGYDEETGQPIYFIDQVR